jgi:hypothetical protein
MFNNSIFCPHRIYVFCIYLRINGDFCPIQHNWLVFITEIKSVYSAVRTGSLSKAVRASSLKGQYFGSINMDIFLLYINLTLSHPILDLVRQYDFPVLLRCRKTSDTVFVAFVRPLSETVRRFSLCSTDFSQQIARVVLFLYLHVFFF